MLSCYRIHRLHMCRNDPLRTLSIAPPWRRLSKVTI